jgi:hypothetical protein
MANLTTLVEQLELAETHTAVFHSGSGWLGVRGFPLQRRVFAHTRRALRLSWPLRHTDTMTA